MDYSQLEFFWILRILGHIQDLVLASPLSWEAPNYKMSYGDPEAIY